jgi:hypothetical protein
LAAVALAEHVDARARLPELTARWLGVPLLGVVPGAGGVRAQASHPTALVQPWRLGRLPPPVSGPTASKE